MRVGGRIDGSGEEVLLDDLASVDTSESGDLLTLLVSLDFEHFPSEEDLNASLSALFKCNLVSIGEFEDFLVRSPILNSSILGRSSLKDVLSEEMLVVESVEVTTFTLVWELRGIADHVSVGVIPTVIVVSIDSFFGIDSVNKHLILTATGFHFVQTFNVL